MDASKILIRVARPLGVAGAKVVHGTEIASLFVGWLIAAPVASAVLVLLLHGSTPNWHAAPMLGLGLFFFAFSLAAIGPMPLLRGYGFRLTFWSLALEGLFAATAWAHGDGFLGETLLLCIPLSLGLGFVTGRRNPDQVIAIVRRLRQYLNGVRKDGQPWSGLQCFAMPTIAAAALGFSVYTALHPALAATIVSTIVTDQKASAIKHATGQDITLPPVPAPAWVSSEWLWLTLVALSAAWLYVVLRRIGSGNLGRGLRLWLLASGEGVGGYGAAFCIYLCVYDYSEPASRIALLILAGLLGALAFGAHQRRRLISTMYGNHDPMFGR